MDSHELANLLHEDADYLLSRPAFMVPRTNASISYWGDKEGFVAAIRATLPGKKNLTSDYYVYFEPRGLKVLQIIVERSAVCRKVQDVKYECDPLLSPDEEALMDEPVMVPAEPMPESAERNGEL